MIGILEAAGNGWIKVQYKKTIRKKEKYHVGYLFFE